MSNDKLQKNVARGQKARDELDEYKGKFAEMQRVYLTELLMKFRADEPTERTVAKLSALDDIVNSLAGDIQAGMRDQKKLDDIAQQAAHRMEDEYTG